MSATKRPREGASSSPAAKAGPARHSTGRRELENDPADDHHDEGYWKALADIAEGLDPDAIDFEPLGDDAPLPAYRGSTGRRRYAG